MFKILYIHQYFETPEESGRTRSYWFAKKLIEKGYKVKVVTSVHSHSKRKAGAYNIEGIEVIYVRNSYDNLMSINGKLWSFIRFMIASSWICLRDRDINLIYATSTPLTVGIPALIRKWIRNTPFIFEVRDLWPEFPIQVGAIKAKPIIVILRWIEKLIYKNAQHIVTLSPGMKEGVVLAGIDADKITVIPNMAKPDLFYPRACNKIIKEKFAFNDKHLKVIHFGTMGVANGLDYIIDAAHNLHKKEVRDIQFYFAGKGAMESILIKRVKDLGISNVHFLGYMNTYEISDVVNCCDITITSFSDLPVLQTNSPNKLFDSLSAGKPIIVNSPGWTKDLVESAKCGLYVNVREPQQLANALLRLKENPAELGKMGKNARDLAIKCYDKELLTEKFYNIVANELNHV